MLAKVFKIDVSQCASCGGGLALAAAITDLMKARRYLKHVGIPHDAPARAPALGALRVHSFVYYQQI